MRARVGALPQHPKGDRHEGRGGGANNRSSRGAAAAAAHAGMSMESLKRQTAHRLRHEGDGDDGSSENNSPGSLNVNVNVSGSAAAKAASEQQTMVNAMHYQAQHPHFPRDPAAAGPGPSSHYVGAMVSPQNSYPSHPRHGPSAGRGADYVPAPASYGVMPPYDIPANYSGESTTRNYTDSQLGVGGAAGQAGAAGAGGGGGGGVAGHHSGSHGNIPQLASASPAAQAASPGPAPPPAPPYSRPSPHQQPHHPQPPLPQHQQYSTPRMPRHATVLKDRGSAENSVEGSDGGHPYYQGGGGNHGHHHRGGHGSKGSPPSLKGRGGGCGSHGKNLNKAGRASGGGSSRTPLPKEMRSPDGRHTPVRDRNGLEGQVLFATPNHGRGRDVPSTPTSAYSEPPQRSRAVANASLQHRQAQQQGQHPHYQNHQNTSPNYNRMRSPDHHHHGARSYPKDAGGLAAGRPGGYYGNTHMKQQHSKLPHGLTVQELKEMTRARLAAEAEVAPGPEGNGSSDQSVHSAGTQGSSKGSADQLSLQGRGGNGGGGSNESASGVAVTRNLVRDNESIRRGEFGNHGGRTNPQGFAHGQQQMRQRPQNQPPPPGYGNYPRRASPPFGVPPPPLPNQFGNGSQRRGPPRQGSPPAFGPSSARAGPQAEQWETASAASAEYPDSGFRGGGGGGVNPAGNAMLFPSPSPMGDSGNMRFNRGRCFSAGATSGVPSSSLFEHRQLLNYCDVQAPLSAGAMGGASNANRQRCATVSPPGMSRLHEDRPFLFSNDEKERLAIPPLSEPRPRLHTTGGLNTHMGGGGGGGGVSLSSAFVPISGKQQQGNNNDLFLPQSPPPPTLERVKFGANDRTISTSSAASNGHGDLPSSMAEAVLASITSTSGGPIGGTVIGGGHGASPFRASMSERDLVGEISPFRVGMSCESSENASSAFRIDTLLPEQGSGSMSLFSSHESGATGGRNLFSSNETSERMLLGTHSWGGAGGGEDFNAGDAGSSFNMGIGHDFGNLLNLSTGPALRGRAATEPVWFGGNDPLLVSRIDPEHNEMSKSGPPRVTSLVDASDPYAGDSSGGFDARGQQQNTSFEGYFK